MTASTGLATLRFIKVPMFPLLHVEVAGFGSRKSTRAAHRANFLPGLYQFQMILKRSKQLPLILGEQGDVITPEFL